MSNPNPVIKFIAEVKIILCLVTSRTPQKIARFYGVSVETKN